MDGDDVLSPRLGGADTVVVLGLSFARAVPGGLGPEAPSVPTSGGGCSPGGIAADPRSCATSRRTPRQAARHLLRSPRQVRGFLDGVGDGPSVTSHQDSHAKW